jgi:hypothetical protein
MPTQLTINVPVENQVLFNKAKKEYEVQVKKKDLHPVYLVANLTEKEYFCSYYFSKETIESYPNFKVIM